LRKLVDIRALDDPVKGASCVKSASPICGLGEYGRR